MIKIELIKSKIQLEGKVRDLKLWLTQKEQVSYNNWKAQPENEKDKSAFDKIIAKLKLEDDGDWLNKEQELIEAELDLKLTSHIYETLQNTLRSLGNPNSGITNEMFQAIQEQYIKGLRI
jgi:signal recognition particle GTPase